MKQHLKIYFSLFILILSFCPISNKDFNAQASSSHNPLVQSSNPDFEILGQSGGGPAAIFNSGSYAYTVSKDGFSVLDLTYINHPVRLGYIALNDLINTNFLFRVDVIVHNQIAYVAAGRLGVIDVSNPSTPALLNNATAPFMDQRWPDDAHVLTISGNTLYVADCYGDYGLMIYTIPLSLRSSI